MWAARSSISASLRFKGDYVLAPCQHNPAERNHVQLRNGVANDGKSLLTNRAIRGNVVGRVDITLIDLIFWNELVNIDGARAFDLDGLYFLILNNHVLALCDLIAAHHVVPRDDLAGLRIDILLLQSVARFPVDPIETHFFAERGGRIERNGARDQRNPKIALPVRTRRHWIRLNNTRRANYTANFSKCLRPLSGVREPRARSSATEKQKFAVRDSALVAWYRSVYAPRTAGAYDSHHRTAGIAGRTRRRGCRVAARGGA